MMGRHLICAAALATALATHAGRSCEQRPPTAQAIERGMQALAGLEPRLVTVVECRFHAGMEFAEIAEYLGVSERTAQRDWRRARAFLLDMLQA